MRQLRLNQDLIINIKSIFFGKTVIAHYGRFFIPILFLIAACGPKEEIGDKPVYTGPMMSIDSVNTLLSDSAMVMLRIRAPKEEAFENGDREWKKGIYLEYFDEEGELSSTFKSDYAYFTNEKNLYHGTGNVIVKNVTNGDQLNTEELFWDPQKHEFYTERFVTITTEDEIHTGEGLTASEDFSSYKILKPAGTFTIEDRPQPADEAN